MVYPRILERMNINNTPVWIAHTKDGNFEKSKLPSWAYNGESSNWKHFEKNAKIGDLIAFKENGVIKGFARYNGVFGDRDSVAHSNEVMGWTGEANNAFNRELGYSMRVLVSFDVHVRKVNRSPVYNVGDESEMLRQAFVRAMIDQLESQQAVWSHL